MGIEASGEGAFSRTRSLKPDIVILEAQQEKSEPETLISRFFNDQREAKIVRLNLEDNTTICYLGYRCKVHSVDDLIKCILKFDGDAPVVPA